MEFQQLTDLGEDYTGGFKRVRWSDVCVRSRRRLSLRSIEAVVTVHPKIECARYEGLEIPVSSGFN